MSISDYHGGGLTLQRVIGDDLKNIDHLIYVSRFATDIETIPALKSKVIDVTSTWDSNLMRRVIGRTRANAISKNLSVIKADAKKAANTIVKRVGKNGQLNGLVCPQGAQSIYTIEALKQHTQLRYTTWVMDDHLITYQGGKWEYPPGVEAVFAKHLQEAEHVFVISPVMQQFYQERFGVKSTVLFGPADPKEENKVSRNTPTQIKIGYFGAVTEWQTDALCAVADALQNTDTTLDIYSVVNKLPDKLNIDGVYFKGRLQQNEVLNTMQRYDAVLLPISFSQKMRSMSEFNIATKMSEYLASGVPVLAIGPAYAGMIKYLKQHNAALIVESLALSDIRHAFSQLSNGEVVKSILHHAQKRVAVETGVTATQKRWRDALSN
ncbi:hypothetical protein ACFQZS_11505 [Mucilaginibacter calamicampi]|uniref:Glucosyltransferase 3-like C-terminal domain-containing protein n=1 Tax=Mucilaginibacter calamicampi TaxID=1302352 RepID=A0ABW2YX33_9SPHI